MLDAEDELSPPPDQEREEPRFDRVDGHQTQHTAHHEVRLVRIAQLCQPRGERGIPGGDVGSRHQRQSRNDQPNAQHFEDGPNHHQSQEYGGGPPLAGVQKKDEFSEQRHHPFGAFPTLFEMGRR